MLTEPSVEPAPARRTSHLGEHLAALLDAIADGVVVHDIHGQLVHANAAAAELWGFSSAQELVSAGHAALASAVELEDSSGAAVSVSDVLGGRALAGEELPEVLVRMRVRNAGERWLRIRSRAMRGAGNEPFAVSTIRDATEAIESERRLRASEHRYAQILDSVQDLVFTKSRDFAVTYANRAACEHYGLSAEELRGATNVPLDQRDFTQQHLADDRAVFETGKVIEQRGEPNTRHDGVRRFFHTIKSPIVDGDGKVVELVGVARDITDQRAVEREAHESQRRLQLALEAGAMGVFEWGLADGRVSWSPAIERMHGLEPGAFDGSAQMAEQLIHPDDREHFNAVLRRTLERHEPHLIRYRIVRPSDDVRWLEAQGWVLEDETRGARVVGIVRDTTEQRESERVRGRALAAEAGQREAERARQRLVSIIDSITDPFSVFDQDLRFVLVNQSAARMLGRTPRDLIGKQAFEAVPEAERTPFHAAYVKVLETREPLAIEEYFAPWDRWYEASVYPIDDGIAVYTRDVTMRKRAFELTSRLARLNALRADISACLADERDISAMLRRVCEALVEHVDVAFARIWTIDEPGTTLLLQASAGMYTHIDGPHRAVPIGKFKIGRIAASRKPHTSNDVGNDPQVGDHAWARREGLSSFAGYPLLVDGKLYGVMAMFSRHKMPEDQLATLESIADLVAQGLVRRRTEIELEHRLEDLARSNAELEQFAYVASHDLQEPLRMVASYNQLLARRYKGKLGEDADEFIGFSVEGVTRMQRLINDLLAYSRVGTRNKDRTEVDMNQVMADVCRNLETAIQEAGAKVTHDPLPTLHADESQMLQLVQNLIGNAIKFRRDDEAPQVHVAVVSNTLGHTFAVRDNGIGIDPQFFERIFVIFQRLNARERYPGTGIGLAICKKIVERHGGRIWVESAAGAGSTIYFHLPLQPRRTS